MANLSNINGKFVVEQTTGYVGVGTTDPNFLIEAAGANSEIALNSTSASIYRLRSTSSDSFIITKNGVGDRLVIDGSGNSTFAGNIFLPTASSYIKFGGYSYIGEDLTEQDSLTIASDSTESIYFAHYNQSTSAYTTTVQIDPSGNVMLDVNNWLQGHVTVGGGTQNLIRSRAMGYPGYYGCQIGQETNHIALFIDPNSVAGGAFSGNVNELMLPNKVIFQQANAVANPTDWLNGQSITLDNGKVGIGTSSPSYKLEVNGGTTLVGGAFYVSTDQSISTNFTYTFRDAVGINNPNSISATPNAGYTMCVGRSNNGAGVSGSLSAVGTIKATAFTVNIDTTAGIGGSNGDVNAAEIGPGYLNLSRDDTAAAQQIRFEKNGALSAWIQTGPSNLSIGTETVNFNVYLQSNLYLNIDTNNTYFNRNNVHIAKSTPQLYLDGRSFGNSGAVLNILGWAATYKNWCIANATSGAGTLNFRVSSAAGGNSGFATVGVISESTGAYTAVSDINKKKDFEKSEIGLKEVMELKPKLYRMKDDDEDSNKHLGFIAQEVKEVIPQAYVEEGEFIGLNERAIIAALTKAIQELKADNDSLKARIETLENN